MIIKKPFPIKKELLNLEPSPKCAFVYSWLICEKCLNLTLKLFCHKSLRILRHFWVTSHHHFPSFHQVVSFKEITTCKNPFFLCVTLTRCRSVVINRLHRYPYIVYFLYISLIGNAYQIVFLLDIASPLAPPLTQEKTQYSMGQMFLEWQSCHYFAEGFKKKHSRECKARP